VLDPLQRLASLPSSVPLTTVDVLIAARSWQITAVQNQDALLDAAEHLAHIPYGFLLWESAIGLAHWLVEQASDLRGKRVLELGAGVGLPGLVARTLGAQVWQTDHDPHALALAAHNAHQNGVSGVAQFEADWCAWDHTAQYDLLLGADILYERAMHPHLEPIFQRNLAPGGRLLLTDPCRPQAFEFATQLENRGWRFAVASLPIQLLPESKPVEVMFYQLTR
jgi:methyltransferase-like protein 23